MPALYHPPTGSTSGYHNRTRSNLSNLILNGFAICGTIAELPDLRSCYGLTPNNSRLAPQKSKSRRPTDKFSRQNLISTNLRKLRLGQTHVRTKTWTDMPEGTSAMLSSGTKAPQFRLPDPHGKLVSTEFEIGDFKDPQGPAGFHTIACMGTTNFKVLPPYFFS